jgi:hypothetical protein
MPLPPQRLPRGLQILHGAALGVGEQFRQAPALDGFPGRIDRPHAADLGVLPRRLRVPPGDVIALIDLALRFDVRQWIIAGRSAAS